MGRSGAITLDNCENVVVKRCTLRNFGTTAITVKGKLNLIEDCHINSIGGTAILLDGGSSETLEAGNNIVRRCDISDWAFYDRVYNPAIKLLGVGNKVIENHLYNSPHAAITLSGNNHLIEGNEIHHVLLEFTDFGAIYAFIGAHQEMRGQIISNNYFHDIGLVGDRVNAIYVDECSADWLINGNLFYNIGSEGKRVSAIQSNTGYHIHIDNNVFIDCSQTFELSYHFTTWGSHRYTGYFKPVWDKKIMDIQKIPQIYLETYPSLKDFIKEDKIWTSTCSFTNNVIGNIGFPLKHQGKFYVTLSSDVTHSDSLVTSAGNRFLSFE